MENQLFFSCFKTSAKIYYTCQAIHIPCHNFGCVSTEVSGGLPYPRTSKPWHFSGQLEQWRRGREQLQFAQRAYSFVFGSPESFLLNEKWKNMLRSDFIKTEPLRSFRMKFMLFMVSSINPAFSSLSFFLVKMLILDRPLIFKLILQILQ